ncbi:hypothetical protein [Amycolatopsis sp. RTGN1]|uniref:hypothetical protein n=1 Tax=Amycolatopsis ponsaeliensis TaxID=2992142 RepID=UPI00254C4FF8|nr:hypothetical protein [Amycolatopsis sp. RTGN1]
MIIAATREMQEWAAEIQGDEVTFRFSPPTEDLTAASELPRVWPGRGLGVLDTSLPGLRAALGEVMKAPAYWHGRAASRPGPGWAPPHRDGEDGFVYFTGPAGQAAPTAGYRAVLCFTVAVVDVRDLRIRVTGYLAAQSPR